MRKKLEKDEFGLTNRHKAILFYLIELYIARSEPVGSKTIAKEWMNNLSSATVRNYLEEMEEMGLLQKPHASAGRIPTEKGLKYYVKELMNKIEIKEKDLNFLDSYYRKLNNLKDRLHITTHFLANVTHQAALVLLPRLEQAGISAIDFIKVSSHKILVVIVFKLGFVENRIIEVDNDFSQRELTNYAISINNLLEMGLSANEIREYILREMKQLKDLYEKLLENLSLYANSQDIIVEGQSNLFDSPEFANVKEMKRIFKAFEEKSKIVSLLDKTMRTNGVIAFIGSEDLNNDFDGIAIVAAPYYKNDRTLGTLGVIGPMRMNYANIIPIVGSAARFLSNVLNKGE